MNRNDFEVLAALLASPKATQRVLASKTGLSLGTVNTVLKELVAGGLVQDKQVTKAGMEALAPYKVDNAVIMAAGLSSRFAPISYERPKGLLNVRGQIMIERQIEQLREVGIDDITVVVGYKKELFFYLEEKYGVKIVVNAEYAARNNHSSLMAVRDQLRRTYICSSDNYFTQNPFALYVYKAYYSAEYSHGPTKEWCLQTSPKGRITGVEIGGADAWYMIGHVFFDGAFSATFTRVLEAEYDLPKTRDMLWEDLYLEHIDELDMEAKRYEDGVIMEFDSLDDLRGFDPLFLKNLDLEIFDNICSTLGCTREEIRDIYPLKQGLTNLSCHFATPTGEYVYRHPGVGTGKIIDRKAEQQAEELAFALGIDETFIKEDPETGWKISRFIPNCKTLDVSDDDQLKQAMELARTLHEGNAVLERSFDFLAEGLKYEEALLTRGPIDIPGYDELRALAFKAASYAAADGAKRCLTHNDFFDLNLLVGEDGSLSLIDWEYAGMSDYASDYGTFVVTCKLDERRALEALECYFGRKPTSAELRHNLAFVGLAGWCWYVWALLKEAEGDCVGDWLYVYYRYAKGYLPKVCDLYEKEA